MRSQLPAVAVWLLDLDIGGRVYRYSTVGMDVPTSDGTLLAYLGGLGEIAAAVGQDSIAVSVMDPGVDWEGLEVSGQPVDGARATLRRLIVGDAIEEAVVYSIGRVKDAVIGIPGSTSSVALTIAMTAPTTRQVPDTADSIAGWPGTIAVDDAGDGSYAAFVTGSPGKGLYSAWPGVYFENAGTKYVLVGKVNGAQDSTGTTVNVWDKTSGVYERRTCNLVVVASTGAIAADVSTPVDGAFTTLPTFGRRYYLGVRSDTQVSAVGVTGGAATGAGGLLAHLAQRYSAEGWDLLSQMQSRDQLDAYEIDAVINTPVDAWTWVRSVLLPILPARVAFGLRGQYVEALTLTAGKADSIAHLEGGKDIDRASGITVSNKIFNDFTLKYSPLDGSAQYLRVHRITGDPSSESVLDNIHAHRLCRDSAGVYGNRPAPPIATRAVWSSATAELVLNQLAMRHALPWYQVEYTAPISMEWLREGDIVTVTDRAFVDRLAILGPVVVGASSIRFTAKFFPLPLVRP